MTRVFIICTMVMVAASGPARAQSMFLDKGQSGLGLELGWVTSDQDDGWMTSLTGSYSGEVDFGLAVGATGQSRAFALGLQWYLARTDESINGGGFLLSIEAGLAEYDVEVPGYRTRTVDARTLSCGPGLFFNLFGNENTTLGLLAIGGYQLIDYAIGSSDGYNFYGVSLPVAVGNRHGTRFLISVGLSGTVDSGDTDQSLYASVGMLFGGKQKEAPNELF